jgi:hypothetical protein
MGMGDELVVLYRPVGRKELQSICELAADTND